MKVLPTATLAFALTLPVGAATAQEVSRPSLVVPPWGGSAPNMAGDISDEVLSAIDSLDQFNRVDWDRLLDSSRVTRAMSATRRAELGCIQGRQLAVVEGIDYVFCGSLLPTPEGVLMELRLYDIEARSTVEFSPLVAQDLESLVEHALSQIMQWRP